MKSLKFALYCLLFSISFSVCSKTNDPQTVIRQLHLPAGFKISIFADNLPNARSLAPAENGVVFVSSRQAGVIYALQDSNQDGISDHTWVIAKGLYLPNGVAYKNGSLFVAEVNRISRFDAILSQLDKPPTPKVIYEKLPSDQAHGWKYLRFGPDNKLYTAIGAPCNICEPDARIYSTLVRLNPDGSEFEVLATGIRNSVGFDWQPESQALFFTENGRDNLGEDVPPDELNQWTQKGQHFGYPYCHGGDILDPEFGKDKHCKDYTAPAWKFSAHMAPLGAHFYTGKQFPAVYKNQLFIAEHGSWNRSQPQGYRIALIKFNGQQPIAEEAFISGWLQADGSASGRPVDVIEPADGSLLISDDKLGVIYRVTYQGKQ